MQFLCHSYAIPKQKDRLLILCQTCADPMQILSKFQQILSKSYAKPMQIICTILNLSKSLEYQCQSNANPSKSYCRSYANPLQMLCKSNARSDKNPMQMLRKSHQILFESFCNSCANPRHVVNPMQILATPIQIIRKCQW